MLTWHDTLSTNLTACWALASLSRLMNGRQRLPHSHTHSLPLSSSLTHTHPHTHTSISLTNNMLTWHDTLPTHVTACWALASLSRLMNGRQRTYTLTLPCMSSALLKNSFGGSCTCVCVCVYIYIYIYIYLYAYICMFSTRISPCTSSALLKNSFGGSCTCICMCVCILL